MKNVCSARRMAGIGAAALTLASFALAQAPQADFGERIDPAGQSRMQPAPRAPAALPTVSAAIDASETPAGPINGVKFEGSDVPYKVAKAAEPFIGRAASIETLKELTAAMSAAYGKSSVALFTIVIPEQDFADGIVRVLVAEGYVESVAFTGDAEGRELGLVKAYAERISAERPTSRTILERYLSLINQIPGLKAEASLRSGSRRGAVTLVLALDYKKPTLSFGFDNRTSRFVKNGQFNAEGKAYRLLREGDETKLNLSSSVNFKDSLYAGVQHSTPLLRDGARLDVGAAALKSRPSDSPVSGNAQIYSAGLSYPVFLTYRRSLTVRVSADVLNSDNAAFGSVIATERTRSARFAASYAQASKRRSASFTARFSRGFDALSAEVTEPLGKPDYIKASGSGSLTQRIGARGLLRITAAGQWTDDALPANERFSVGGANFGRGFETSLLSADRGAAVLVEPAVRPFLSGPFRKSELYAFADYAQVSVEPRGLAAARTIDLGSYGFGVRAALKDKALLEIEFARPYDKPADAYAADWRISVRWRLNFRP